MDIVRMIITPEQAKLWMDVPTEKRTLKSTMVTRLTNAILEDKWESENGATICIGENGEVIDGNHRLTAVIKANKPIQAYVCFNVKPSTTIDNGTVRTPPDIVTMTGFAKIYPDLKNAHMLALVSFSIGVLAHKFTAKSDVDKIIDTYTANQKLFDDAFDVRKAANGVRLAGCNKAAVLYAIATAVASGVDLDLLKEWYQILANGLYADAKLRDVKSAKSIIGFRNQLATLYSKSRSFENEMLVVKKAMSSIDHYNKNEECHSLKGTLVYPLLDISGQQKLSI